MRSDYETLLKKHNLLLKENAKLKAENTFLKGKLGFTMLKIKTPQKFQYNPSTNTIHLEKK